MTEAEERAAFEAWYDAQPEGRINPFDVWQSRAALSAPAVPEGWKLVPIEPTPEMLDAVRNGPEHETWREGYHAMLAAAPSPQEQTP